MTGQKESKVAQLTACVQTIPVILEVAQRNKMMFAEFFFFFSSSSSRLPELGRVLCRD